MFDYELDLIHRGRLGALFLVASKGMGSYRVASGQQEMRQSAPGMHWLRWIMRWTFKVALCLSFTENICCFGSKQMATTCHLSDSVESSNLKSNPKKACQPCVAWMNLPEIDSIGDIKRKDLVQCLDLVPIIEQSSNFLMVDEYRG